MTKILPGDFHYPDRALLAEPYPFYAAMRDNQPVYREPKSGVFFISRYDDIVEAVRHPEIFSSKRDLMPETDPEIAAIRAKGFRDSTSLTCSDPPEHQRFRSLVTKVFTPQVFAGMEAGIRALCNRLVDRVIDQGIVDLQREYAGPLPLTVIADLLGLDHSDLAELKRYSDNYTATLGAQSCPLSRPRMIECAQSLTDLQLYLSRVIEARQAGAGDDVVSRLLAANARAKQPLDHALLVDMLRIFFIGGNETTTLAIGSMTYHLLSSPENYRRVEDDPKLIPRAIEETLRCEAPNQWVLRNVTRDTSLGGVELPVGSKVCLLWGSANRDRDRFGADAERFYLDRPDSQKHLTFGFGAHFCAGSALARMELRITLETFIARLRNLRLKPDEPVRYNAHPVMRGLESLVVQFEPR